MGGRGAHVIRQDNVVLQQLILHEEGEELELDEPTSTNAGQAAPPAPAPRPAELPTPVAQGMPQELQQALKAANRAKNRARLFAFVVGVVTFMIGTVAGFAGGLLMSMFNPLDLGATGTAEPVLQLSAPAGVEVYLDDELQGTAGEGLMELSLTAELPARLRVMRDGEELFSQSYILQANELRALTLQVEQAPASPE